MRLLQWEKAYSFISTKELGKTTVFNCEQLLNAEEPIISNVEGNLTSFNVVQPSKAALSIFLTPSGILIFSNDVQ